MSLGLQDAYEQPLFEAVITPHRSLSPAGLRTLLAVIAVLAGLVSLRFWFIGAWPVIGFSVLEIGLAALLLWLNHRSARTREMLYLHDDRLRVVRVDAAGKSHERVLPSAWLNVRLDDQPRRVLRLFLSTRTIDEEIGAALGEAEKRDLAEALSTALYNARHPRFDNKQLSEP